MNNNIETERFLRLKRQNGKSFRYLKELLKDENIIKMIMNIKEKDNYIL